MTTVTRTKYVRLTLDEISNMMEIDRPRVAAYVSILEAKKLAKVVGKVPANSTDGRGKPNKVYRIQKALLFV